jgi:hypothetical protein
MRSAMTLPSRIASSHRRRRSGASGRVALGEDQIDHRKHAGQAIGQQMVGGDLQSGPGVTDLSLGAHQPLRHGGLADQERAGDLAGGQALDGIIRATQPLTG